jgi:hypothetical protein
MLEYYFELAQTLGTVLNRGAQADARGSTQVLDLGGQAFARGSCLSHASPCVVMTEAMRISSKSPSSNGAAATGWSSPISL